VPVGFLFGSGRDNFPPNKKEKKYILFFLNKTFIQLSVSGKIYTFVAKLRVFEMFRICLISLLLLVSGSTWAGIAENNYKDKKATFIAINSNFGTLMKTNDFLKAAEIPYSSSYALKFGFNSKGDSWRDFAYGMPYYGIGLYSINFKDNNGLGYPVSLYLFQGATISELSSRLKLNYEWNLGVSTNWEPYDRFDNPTMDAIGSNVNVHVALNLMLRYAVNNNIDLNLGAAFTHFSNGAYQQPNAGVNQFSGFLELVYKFNVESILKKELFNNEPFTPHYDHDILLNISSRQVMADTVNTNLPSEYTRHRFKIFDLSYGLMKVPNYRYKYGAGLDVLYDESSGAKMWREIHPEDKEVYERVKLAPLTDRLSLGASLRGEVVMPGYSIFANLGWNLIHGNKKDQRLYQVIGIKLYLRDNFFGTFGIRATHFTKAQYLYWSLGYTINGRSYSKR
jgi:hypothetical protein